MPGQSLKPDKAPAPYRVPRKPRKPQAEDRGVFREVLSDIKKGLPFSVPRGIRTKPGSAGAWVPSSFTPPTGHRHPLSTGGKRSKSGWHFLSSTNVYGLRSRAEMQFPEAFRPVQDKYWLELSDEERQSHIAIQAEAMKKLFYRPATEDLKPLTAAEEAYNDAVVRRRQAISRRKKRKPRTYEERMRMEEEERKAPLIRRYHARQLSQFESSSFYTASPIDVPILIPGAKKARKALFSATTKPVKLKLSQRPWGVRYKKATVPTVDTKGFDQAKVEEFNNAFGLRSRAVTAYPEAYQSVSKYFWRDPGEEHRNQLMKVQAKAMEKVGFERGADKFFIKDFDPSMENIYSTGYDDDDDDGPDLPSKYDASGLPAYDLDDERVSIQGRFGDLEFGEEKKPGPWEFTLTKAINVPLGIFLMFTGLVLVYTGSFGVLNVLMWVPGVICVMLGIALSLPPVD